MIQRIGLYETVAHAHFLYYFIRIIPKDVECHLYLNKQVRKDLLAIDPDVETRCTIHFYRFRFFKIFFNLFVSFHSRKLDAMVINSLLGSRDDILSYFFLRPFCSSFIVDALYGDVYLNNQNFFRYGPFFNTLGRYVNKYHHRRSKGILVHSQIVKEKLSFLKKPLIYCPYTFYEGKRTKVSNRFKITIPGSIHEFRRDYELVIQALKACLDKDPSFSDRIEIVFFGSNREGSHYLSHILNLVKKLNLGKELLPITYFENSSYLPEKEYRDVIESTDLVLNPLNNANFYQNGRYCGGLCESISYGIPGIYPSWYQVPKELESSCLFYSNKEDLISLFLNCFNNQPTFMSLKQTALDNSACFSVSSFKDSLWDSLVRSREE